MLRTVDEALVDTAVKIGLQALVDMIKLGVQGQQNALKIEVGGEIWEVSVKRVPKTSRQKSTLNTVLALLCCLPLYT